MQYLKLSSGKTIIELHNNWLGEETVIVNGQIVSKISSVWGANHYFNIMEDGHTARYVLTTKVNAHMQVLIDLTRNGQMVHSNLAVPYGSAPQQPESKFKNQGLKYLKEYELDEAVEEFMKALEYNPQDPESYFHLACAYSVMEQTDKGYESLKLSVEYGLKDTELILNHDMLAFLRMHPTFEVFVASGFVNYSL
jgi:hypothetical protein